MYARARTVEGEGNWADASDLFWRLTSRYPDSRPALAAPLHVIRALLDAGRRDDAASALRRASEYYTDIIERDSAAISPRYLSMDCLLEAYLLLDRPQEAVAALNGATRASRDDARAVAGLKIASLSRFRSGDLQNAVEILEKTLVGFPRSRYSRCVHWRLQRTREARDERSG
jgi:tetratricopeptide (TPR) repeat protein